MRFLSDRRRVLQPSKSLPISQATKQGSLPIYCMSSRINVKADCAACCLPIASFSVNAWKPASGRLVDDSTASDTAFLVVGSCRSREDLRGQGEGGPLQPSSSSTHDDYRTPILSAPEIPSATAGWSARHLARSHAGAIARGMVPAALSRAQRRLFPIFLDATLHEAGSHLT